MSHSEVKDNIQSCLEDGTRKGREDTQTAAYDKSILDSLPCKVVMIYSNWSLASIEEKLYEYTADEFSMCRVVRFKGEETDRTLCLMRVTLLNRLIDEGFDRRRRELDFSCAELRLGVYNFPKSGESKNLFISLPKDLSSSECRSQLSQKLDNFTKFGLCSAEDMKLNLIVSSRDSNTHSGTAFITFKKETPVEIIACVKILLHDSWLLTSTGERHSLLQCYWARERPVGDKSYNKNEKNPHIQTVESSSEVKCGSKTKDFDEDIHKNEDDVSSEEFIETMSKSMTIRSRRNKQLS